MPSYRRVSDKDYQESFAGKPTASGRAKEAFAIAHDTRKFEIELYWRRSAYFWAFVAAAFAGYFALASSSQAGTTGQENLVPYQLLVAIVGMTFSLSWHLVGRASKFWQENWEWHIDHLEESISGPLYQTIMNPRRKVALSPIDPVPLSVSRINMLLSLIVTL